MRLEGKVAAITGAASGFGEGMARRFAQEGAKVVVADLRGDEAKKVADSIGESAIAVEADVSRMQDNQAIVSAATSNFGSCGIFVVNAGFTHKNMPLLDVDEQTFDRVADVNMKALYHATRAVVPVMEKQGGGSILATASTAGLTRIILSTSLSVRACTAHATAK